MAVEAVTRPMEAAVTLAAPEAITADAFRTK